MKRIARLLFVVIPLFVVAACKPKSLPETYLTATFPPLPTPLVADSGTPASQPSATPRCDAALITDVTIPLDTELSPGQAFIKTWQIQNTSSCDWGPDIRLTYLGGALMQAPSSISVPDIPIGESTKFSLEMVAPLEPGTYASLWQLQTGDGMVLGRQLWVRIIVPGEDRSSNPLPASTPVASDNCVLNAAFEADVTIPDDTSIPPGEGFVKTWRIQNTGTCQWETGYKFTFIMGDAMTDTPYSVDVTPTASGATVDVSVPMTAPADPGTYTSIWSMQSPDGTLFGARLFAQIVVPEPESESQTTTQATPTTSATSVPSYSPPATAISGITNRSRQIYLSGQQKGNKPYVFAKVGDSITSSWPFLFQIEDNIEDLHDYAYLQDVINNFRVDTPDGGTSFSRSSLTAYGGWTSNDLLDPAKADPICAGVTPVECEYQRIKPSISIIMIGTNDADETVTSGRYEENLERVVEISIDMGVIPVLTTIPWNLYHDVPAYNEVIVRVARSYDIPLIDYWTLMEQAPDRGLSEDEVHPSVPPDNNAVNFSPGNLQYGYTIRNLVTLQMIDAIWKQVILE